MAERSGRTSREAVGKVRAVDLEDGRWVAEDVRDLDGGVVSVGAVDPHRVVAESLQIGADVGGDGIRPAEQIDRVAGGKNALNFEPHRVGESRARCQQQRTLEAGGERPTGELVSEIIRAREHDGSGRELVREADLGDPNRRRDAIGARDPGQRALPRRGGGRRRGRSDAARPWSRPR